MTPEVKKKIEQNRRGIVPEGYKKGKIGIVPAEWDETPFAALFTSISDYTDDLAKYPLYSLTIEDGITAKTERYERSHLVKKENAYKIVRPNDFAYNPMNIRFGAVARHKGSFPVAVSGYYDIFTTVHESDLAFMDSFLTCDSMLTYYNKVSTGSLVEKQRVHFSEFMNFSFPLPPLDERKKIAEILTTQDKLIELQQAKIDELKKLKKAFLSRMFPTDGCNVPEVRFPGFTEAWEQRKVGDFLTVSRIPGHTGFDAKKLTVKLWGKGVVEKTDISNGSINTQYYIRREGQFMYGKLDFLHAAFGIVPKSLDKYESTLDSPAFDMHGIDGQFLLKQVTKEDFYLKYGTIANGGRKAKRIHEDTFLDMLLLVPTYKEQRKIGQFFLSLDNLIALHQRKLDEMQKYKKALMQLLLTGIVRVKI